MYGLISYLSMKNQKHWSSHACCCNQAHQAKYHNMALNSQASIVFCNLWGWSWQGYTSASTWKSIILAPVIGLGTSPLGKRKKWIKYFDLYLVFFKDILPGLFICHYVTHMWTHNFTVCYVWKLGLMSRRGRGGWFEAAGRETFHRWWWELK